jgi:hypothetical protein
VPEFLVKDVPIKPTPGGTSSVSGVETMTLDAKIVRNASAITVIGSVVSAKFHTTTVGSPKFEITVTCEAKYVSGLSYEAKVTWTIEPNAPAGPGNVPPADLYIESLTVRILLILSP